MTIESESIPYEPVRLRGERLLILAPHPDDEVIGCGGLIAQHVREQRRVRAVIATDGCEADGAGADREAYRDRRERESCEGLALLGQDIGIEFLRFPDRSLTSRAEELIVRLREAIAAFRPDLILAPSPIEIHPDHLALSRAFCSLVQGDETLFADLAFARVAFYEVSQPIRPNSLVDISDVAEAKFGALAAHESQLALRDYGAFVRGLNAYRAMTLPVGTRFAEGYWTTDLTQLRTMPFSALRQSVSGAPTLEVTGERLPISVVIRTKDRPALLREAIASVQGNGYAAEIIVVNDGGVRPEDVQGVTLVNHEQTLGRSVAANEGVRKASSPFIAFLDDDDLYYPEHLPTLANAAAQSPERAAWYSDAVSAFLRIGESGSYETHSRLRLFGQDFDRDLLLVDNYIPLPTLLIPRASFLDLGGFDRAFDLFEDWDFLIRLGRRGDFVHVPRVTCEIRHHEGGGSITLTTPEGSAAFREAKLRVWAKHRELLDDDVLANAFERQKRRIASIFSFLVEEKGRRHHAETDIARLEREKTSLMSELYTVTTAAQQAELRARELAPLEPLVAELQRDRDANARYAAELQTALQGRQQAVEAGQQALAASQRAFDEGQTTIAALYAEIHRLQGLLDTIYGSRTWKLHSMVEKMKGRG
jgi:LmbE family N-acetylglucosaminyl deacetylase/glycosyltransferase involved in cell wall biosynthesis